MLYAKRVTILSGSIPDLSVGWALLQRGWDVTVFEATEVELQNRGEGVITAQTLFDVFTQLDVTDKDKIGVQTVAWRYEFNKIADLLATVICIFLLLSISQTTQASSSSFLNDDNAPRLFVQAQLGIASESDFGPALFFHYEPPFEPTTVFAISIGKQVGNNFLRWPASIVVYGSVHYFGERDTQPDVLGASAYIKAYRQFRLGSRRIPIRLGLGEGLSYVERIPSVEVMDFLPQSSSRLVNYLEWTLQTSVGHFLGRPEGRFSATIRDVYIGYSIFHRSTIFGLLASKGGGVNYMGISIELVMD